MVLEDIKELGVKLAIKIKEIKTNDLYIVESLEAPEVIEVKTEALPVENKKIIELESFQVTKQIENIVKTFNKIPVELTLNKKQIKGLIYNEADNSINVLDLNKTATNINDICPFDQKLILLSMSKKINFTINMSKSEIFKTAHKLAKTFEGNYSACLSMALKEVYAKIKSLKETSLKETSLSLAA